MKKLASKPSLIAIILSMAFLPLTGANDKVITDLIAELAKLGFTVSTDPGNLSADVIIQIVK